MNGRVVWASALWLTLLSCAAPTPRSPAVPRGEPTPLRAAPVRAGSPKAEQWAAAREVFEQRCVVCHGCYDAPCQLQLGSFEGIERGATKTQVYESTRLLASAPTRLFVDAQGRAGWRERDFFPVLPEGKVDAQHSLLVRMLELKRTHPLATGVPLARDFELGLDREQVCANDDEFDAFAREHPLWGMPYALPGLTTLEHEALVGWVTAGAPHTAPPELSAKVLGGIDRWEAFFNEPSVKGRLSARYIYEHLFLASLYFAGTDERSFFRLVRSRTPPGTAIDEIATRRPFDDPGEGPLYYRLRRQHATTLAKTHMPYALSDVRLARFRRLFLDAKYEAGTLPSYDPERAANPFRTFAALPVQARYRFMLEEAQFTMMGFIKGPVCRGQVALDVIEDRFWIGFVDPESPILDQEAEFLATAKHHLDLPAESVSNAPLAHWLRYAHHQNEYLTAKSKFLTRLAKHTPVFLDLIWDGDGTNGNAALTVLRHFDSASVTKGFVGTAPKTAWIVGYAVLERIHYLLVAGFDVFGNVGHQLNTRLYMDFLRMEAEHNFLLLLPRSRRSALVDKWYRDVRGAVKDQVYGKVARFDQESAIPYRTNEPEQELFDMLRRHLSPVLDHRYDLGAFEDPTLRQTLERLGGVTGTPASHLPETSFVELQRAGGDSLYFTITRDSAHTNVARLFGEDDRRRPREDRLVVTAGFLGAYPNALFSVQAGELAELVDHIAALNNRADYAALRARFGVSRTDPSFWATSDRMQGAYRALEPVEGGLFDLNRLDPD